MKTCSKCKLELSIDSFRKDVTKKDGLTSSCKECKKKVDINYITNNIDKVLKKRKEYVKKNKENKKKYDLNYRINNKEKRNESLKKYYIKNNIKINERRKKYNSKRKKEDYVYKFKCNVRSLISKSFKRGVNQFKKTASTESILQCNIKDFKAHIEKQFTEGMSFDNHGDWHLDHIIPLASAKTEDEVIKLNHYTNFQPLWAIDNLRKGSKV
jgi:hypothetical protein